MYSVSNTISGETLPTYLRNSLVSNAKNSLSTKLFIFGTPLPILYLSSKYDEKTFLTKLEPELGYVPGNFCLTFRFLNFGRCKYSGSMEQVMNTFINMCKNENSKPNSTLLEFIK